MEWLNRDDNPCLRGAEARDGAFPPISVPATVPCFLSLYSGFVPTAYSFDEGRRQAAVVRLANLCLDAPTHAHELDAGAEIERVLWRAQWTLKGVGQVLAGWLRGGEPSSILMTESGAACLPGLPPFLICEMAFLHVVRQGDDTIRFDPSFSRWWEDPARTEWGALRASADALTRFMDEAESALDWGASPASSVLETVGERIDAIRDALREAQRSIDVAVGKTGERGPRPDAELPADPSDLEVYLWLSCGVPRDKLYVLFPAINDRQLRRDRVRTALFEAKKLLFPTRLRAGEQGLPNRSAS